MKNLKQLAQNLAFILGGIFALYIAWITGTGEILQYVHFEDPLNEMFFCCASLMVGGCCLVAGLSKS